MEMNKNALPPLPKSSLKAPSKAISSEKVITVDAAVQKKLDIAAGALSVLKG